MDCLHQLIRFFLLLFSSVFEEVHENSKDVWKWEMYRLVAEYDKWPGLAPPFVILEDIFKCFKSIWKVTCRRRKEDRKFISDPHVIGARNAVINFIKINPNGFIDTNPLITTITLLNYSF